MSAMTFWHGGVRPADGLLVPQEMSRSGDAGDGWVYVTTSRYLAATYAATLPRSWVMEVEPVGQVERDPGSILDCSFRCRSAVVLRSFTLSREERTDFAQHVQRIQELVAALDSARAS